VTNNKKIHRNLIFNADGFFHPAHKRFMIEMSFSFSNHFQTSARVEAARAAGAA
jgi:hypothetical protein